MASLLVIGGTGFFGKSILDAYRRGLLTSWGIDRIEVVARKARNLSILNPELMSANVFLHDLDITSCNHLPYADYVIHAAASTDARDYLSKPEEGRKNIQLGTANFCKLVATHLSKSKIVYVSSGAVYGQQPGQMNHLEECFQLQDLNALNLGKRDYAAAKRNGETYIEALGRELGFDVAIARCFTFVGLYLPRNQHFAIGNFMEDGLNRRPIQVNALHPVYRSYLYADDLVSWLMTIANKANPACPIVNVGSDEAILVGDLANKVADYFDVKVHIPTFSSLAVDRYIPSIKRAMEMGCKKPLNLDAALNASFNALERYNNIYEFDKKLFR